MRKFISVTLFYALLFTLITGIVLYIMPHGRVAYWTDWHLLGLNKDQWESIHILFGLIMLVAGIWHLCLNWKAFKRYVWPKNKVSPSFVGLTLLSFLLLLTAIKDLPPASILMDWKEQLKSAWQPKAFIPPPVPHAELLPLETLVKKEGLSLDQALQLLQEKNIVVPSPKLSLKEIARLNGTSPEAIYRLLIKNRPNQQGAVSIPQPGRRTLREICSALGYNQETCTRVLAKHGLTPVWDKPLKEWVFQKGVTPHEIIQWLTEEKASLTGNPPQTLGGPGSQKR